LWSSRRNTLDDASPLQQRTPHEHPAIDFRNAANYWKSWANKTRKEFGSLSKDVVDLYKRSLLLIRMNADNNGGIIAATDNDIMAFNRDTYTYVWPRDGAFVSLALDRAGYSEISRRFFDFCCRVQTPDGYLLHKYNPDGSLGSSWHAWYKDGESQLPMQEDETALVLYAMYRHFKLGQDFEFLQKMYETFIKKAAQFLCDFREAGSGLPLPSYDLWEERRAVFTYTTATVIAGLHAAAQMSQMIGHHQHSERYQNVADEMRQALLFHLYDEKEGRFLKSIKRKDGKTVERDATPDASIAVLWKLGVLSYDDPRVVSTQNQLHDKLTVKTPVGGMARYTDDFYHIPGSPSADVPGNPWVLTTLWDMEWRILMAKSLEELHALRPTFDWVLKYATKTGVIAEQLHPYDGTPLSVAPLTWSHATYVDTVLAYVEKEKELMKEAHG